MARPRPWRRLAPLRLAALSATLAGAGCELREITLVDVEPVVVAEVYVNFTADPSDTEVRALLHWTVGADLSAVPDLSLTSLTVRRADGLVLPLVEQEIDECVSGSELMPSEIGACFLADPALTAALRPGDVLEVEIALPDGGALSGSTAVPTAFEIEGRPDVCTLDPNTLLPIRWSPAEGAWAYVNETAIRGLPDALRSEGIVVEEDPLYLLGLSISDQDTDIVFPSEFGVFNRFDLTQDLAVRLQSGLPPETSAEVSITAVDRNYVNWARGGNFNPSGQVRVPSLHGDGTGVFASTVNRSFALFAAPDLVGVPDCPRPTLP